jgi:hypothetical protein
MKRSHRKIRLFLVPLAAAVAIAITAMTRRPATLDREPGPGK